MTAQRFLWRRTADPHTCLFFPGMITGRLTSNHPFSVRMFVLLTKEKLWFLSGTNNLNLPWASISFSTMQERHAHMKHVTPQKLHLCNGKKPAEKRGFPLGGSTEQYWVVAQKGRGLLYRNIYAWTKIGLCTGILKTTSQSLMCYSVHLIQNLIIQKNLVLLLWIRRQVPVFGSLRV